MTYLDGVGSERRKQYEEAHELYMAACEADPDNMIARLRAANCLERMATGAQDPALRFQRQVETLAAYTSIQIRRDSIFEASFRASVLLSVLSSEPPEKLKGCPLLEATTARLERTMSDTADPGASPWETLTRLTRSRWRRLRLGPEPKANSRLEAAALEEARRARHQLRPFRTLCHEYRLRHRFEPTGRDRRQLRKALGISKMAQKARSERTACGRARTEHRRVVPGAREQLRPPVTPDAGGGRCGGWCNGITSAARWHVAGWQAHYNAACFYASCRERPDRGGTPPPARAQALGFALDQAGGAFDCAYVRDEDPDLTGAAPPRDRSASPTSGPGMPGQLVIHYEATEAEASWKLRAGVRRPRPTRTARTRVSPP